MKRSPIAKKRATKRRVAAVCAVLRCKRRPSVRGMCMTHARTKADQAFSLFIRERDRTCIAAKAFPHIVCNGGLQCMHLISRRYRATRWDELNAVAGCAAHHKYMTEHPLEHDAWCERSLGREVWRAQRERAMAMPELGAIHMDRWLPEEAA